MQRLLDVVAQIEGARVVACDGQRVLDAVAAVVLPVARAYDGLHSAVFCGSGHMETMNDMSQVEMFSLGGTQVEMFSLGGDTSGNVQSGGDTSGR